MLAHNYSQSQQQQQPSSSSVQPQQPSSGGQQQSQDQLTQHASTMQTMRLRDDPPPINNPSNNSAMPANAGTASTGTASRPSRKRKTPPTVSATDGPLPPPPPHQQQHPGIPPNFQHILPPPHALAPPPGMHPHHPGPIPHTYQYAPGPEYPHPPPTQEQQGHQQAGSASPTGGAGGGRTLSQSKRAEQNRKAQRAFRERRDQHVKALESRSQLLDAALASADEANRRWEECRALVDQLRIENAALRGALSQTQQMGAGQAQAQLLAGNPTSNPTSHTVGQQQQQESPGEGGENKDSVAKD